LRERAEELAAEAKGSAREEEVVESLRSLQLLPTSYALQVAGAVSSASGTFVARRPIAGCGTCPTTGMTLEDLLSRHGITADTSGHSSPEIEMPAARHTFGSSFTHDRKSFNGRHPQKVSAKCPLPPDSSPRLPVLLASPNRHLQGGFAKVGLDDADGVPHQKIETLQTIRPTKTTQGFHDQAQRHTDGGVEYSQGDSYQKQEQTKVDTTRRSSLEAAAEKFFGISPQKAEISRPTKLMEGAKGFANRARRLSAPAISVSSRTASDEMSPASDLQPGWSGLTPQATFRSVGVSVTRDDEVHHTAATAEECEENSSMVSQRRNSARRKSVTAIEFNEFASPPSVAVGRSSLSNRPSTHGTSHGAASPPASSRPGTRGNSTRPGTSLNVQDRASERASARPSGAQDVGEQVDASILDCQDLATFVELGGDSATSRELDTCVFSDIQPPQQRPRQLIVKKLRKIPIVLASPPLSQKANGTSGARPSELPSVTAPSNSANGSASPPVLAPAVQGSGSSVVHTQQHPGSSKVIVHTQKRSLGAKAREMTTCAQRDSNKAADHFDDGRTSELGIESRQSFGVLGRQPLEEEEASCSSAREIPRPMRLSSLTPRSPAVGAQAKRES